MLLRAGTFVVHDAGHGRPGCHRRASGPDLAPLLDGFNEWPAFMRQDPIGSLYYADPVAAYPEFVLVAVDRAQPDRLVAKGYSVPFTWDDDPAEVAARERLGRRDRRGDAGPPRGPARQPRLGPRDLDPARPAWPGYLRGDARSDA